MKKFSQLIKESKTLSIQDDSVNYLSETEIKKYLEIGAKFISDETKNICKWLIDNNATYIKQLSTGDSDNALVDFYNAGTPKDSSLKDLYKWIGTVVKSGRILEIPTFQTKNQFEQIINKEASIDEVVLDLETEAGRNEVAKRYTPLVHKIANSWIGKTALDKDDLFAYGMRGLVYAMNYYGKKRDKLKEKEANGEEVDISKYRSYTFLQFAAQMIRYNILDGARNDSHLVRIPISRQKKEKDEKGFIAKSNSVSGDKKMGSKDGGDGKSLFDLVGGMENPGKDIDRREIEDLWDDIMKTLKEKFNDQTMDIFMNHFGFGLKDGDKKLSGKEMAAKYGYSSPSSITAEVTKVLNFIRKDKTMYQKFCDIFELMQEAKHDEDEYENDEEPIYVNSNLSKQFDVLNDIDGND